MFYPSESTKFQKFSWTDDSVGIVERRGKAEEGMQEINGDGDLTWGSGHTICIFR